jgi:hypothetical protein
MQLKPRAQVALDRTKAGLGFRDERLADGAVCPNQSRLPCASTGNLQGNTRDFALRIQAASPTFSRKRATFGSWP